MKKSYLSFCLSPILLATFSAYADSIEVITVTGNNTELIEKSLAAEQVSNPDISSWLNSIPGAHVNRNGPLTGIAQYRGLFGDRVAATINGQTIIGAGPNAMDTPLSYSPAIITDTVSVYRGIAPVSAGTETLGGAVKVRTKKAKVSDSDKVAVNGKVVGSHASMNDGSRGAAYINVATHDIAVLAYVDTTSANDSDAADTGKIEPTEYNKTQTGVSLTVKSDSSTHGMSYDYTDTSDTGTPSLPMDIIYIYSNRYGLNGSYDMDYGELNWQFGYHDAEHAMDNFSLRNNEDPSTFKINTTNTDSYDFSLQWQDSMWTIGIDGYKATHDAVITNPNNMMFRVVNFNNVKDTRAGLFVEWEHHYDKTKVQTGVRVNHIAADSDDVSHHMSSKNQAIANLMTEFNSADRDVTDTNFDMVLHVNHQLSDDTTFSASLARKERAPSYQERYLWVPMEATGGLGDGNTYLGDINLDSEVAYQSNFGFNFNQSNLSFMADAYYQRIDDYIQGVPSENPGAKMLAKKMSNNDHLLQFDNVEASLYGLDSYGHYQVTSEISISLLVSYVRGKREDISDDLYRISPLKGKLKLSYQNDMLDTGISITGLAKQDKVSSTNQEAETSGYAFVDAHLDYYFANDFTIKTGINNLFDREHQDHLGGYNRAKGTDTPVMTRLPSQGRSVRMEVSYRF